MPDEDDRPKRDDEEPKGEEPEGDREPKDGEPTGDGEPKDDPPSDNTTRERGRVRRSGDCLVEAIFRFEFQSLDKDGDATKVGARLWSALRPEFGLSTKGQLLAQIKVLRLMPEPGTCTVTVTRSLPSPAIPNNVRTAKGTVATIRAAFDRQPGITIAPPTILAGSPPLTETITATVVWHPENHEKPCPPLIETVQVRWFRGRGFQYIKPETSGDKKKTHARNGETAIPRPPPPPGEEPGQDDKWVVPTELYWVVKDPEGCCKTGKGHAVIQFVKHSWTLKEKPKIKGKDAWNLDILPEEIPTADGEPYDPTFTHNPQGSDPTADPVVYPIPYGKKGNAILQVDKPGIAVPLYDRLVESGGSFRWDFRSYLVCAIDGGLSADYLASGRVAQEFEWSITWTFKKGRPPTVKGSKKSLKKHGKCKPLKDRLKKAKLTRAFKKPRPHVIEVRSGRRP